MQFKVLGPLEVADGAGVVALGGRNQRALLTLLLLHAGTPVSAEKLVDQLWGGHPPRTATTSLQNTISQLRKLLGAEVVRTTPAGYALVLDEHELDLSRFERLVAEARTAAPPRRSELLREALCLWRGPPLADSEQEEFAQAEIRRLEDLRLGALEARVDADLEAGADAELVGELEELVLRHPLRERLRRQLMLALYRSGRQAEALDVYHEARRLLLDELGLEPGPELQALYGSILRQERTLLRARPPKLQDHFDEVARALAAGRLVPVLGPGAAGVSSAELARLLSDKFELDGHERGLAYLSQAIAARNGIGPLHDELHVALDLDPEPCLVHSWLAALPPLLRLKGLPQQLIVSTAFDTGVERAFAAVGEEIDVVAYVASGRHRGKFLHLAPDGTATVVDEPNTYTGLALEQRPALLKIHGHVDRGTTRERETFVICEDDHIDYMSGGDATGAVPVQLGARLRRSHLLFLGYDVDDWCLRVFLRRVWGGDRVAYRSWAVQPAVDAVARQLWQAQGAEAYEVSLDLYVEQLARVTGELAGDEA